MNNSDKPAFVDGSSNGDIGSSGLTKREYFAGLAMQGMLANPSILQNANNPHTFCEELCLASVEQADELLNQLEKKIIFR